MVGTPIVTTILDNSWEFYTLQDLEYHLLKGGRALLKQKGTRYGEPEGTPPHGLEYHPLNGGRALQKQKRDTRWCVSGGTPARTRTVLFGSGGRRSVH